VSDANVVKLLQPGSFGDPLTEVLRNGARVLLAQAVEAEVAEFLAKHIDLKIACGLNRVVRHGHLPEREVMTGIGPVSVRQPRLRDRGVAAENVERIRFTPAILPPYTRRSRSLEVLIPILYLKGISTGDFEGALAALLGKDAPGLSASTIARLKEVWLDEHQHWSKRDLSAKRYVYVWADGIYLQARLEDAKHCILVIIGATPEGKKELLGFTDGARESAQDWRELLLDLKNRGLVIAPELAVADGALGFWKALGEIWRTYTRAALLGAQDGQHPQQTAEEPAAESQAVTAGNLDGRDQQGCRGRLRRLHRGLPAEIREGRRMPGEGSPGPARILRFPCRTLETPPDLEPDREHLCHSAAPHDPLEGLPLE
jgi:Transposase, Mutator family